MENHAAAGPLEKFSGLSSDELMEIWKQHDTYQYSGADFEFIKKTLEDRGLYLKPHEAKEAAKLVGISGWLILPAIALIGIPILNVVSIGQGLELIDNVPSRFESVVNVAIFADAAILVFALVVAFLFYTKKAATPKAFIALMVTNLVLVFIVSMMFYDVGGERAMDEFMPLLVRAIIGAAVWIPYWLKSVRVKNTFVN